MTANVLEGDREMCITVSMDGYLSKPIRVNELVDVLVKAERNKYVITSEGLSKDIV